MSLPGSFANDYKSHKRRERLLLSVQTRYLEGKGRPKIRMFGPEKRNDLTLDKKAGKKPEPDRSKETRHSR